MKKEEIYKSEYKTKAEKLMGFSDNEKFIGNKLKKFYKEIYNIELISVLVKKNIKQSSLETDKFEFYILIKDKNKPIFKHKLIKSYILDCSKCNYQELISMIYNEVDKKISEYCTKKYLNNKNK